jgi:hypothetical protein
MALADDVYISCPKVSDDQRHALSGLLVKFSVVNMEKIISRVSFVTDPVLKDAAQDHILEDQDIACIWEKYSGKRLFSSPINSPPGEARCRHGENKNNARDGCKVVFFGSPEYRKAL